MPSGYVGGFGGLGDAGVARVQQRYGLRRDRVPPERRRCRLDYLVKDVRGQLAYTVAMERSNVLYAGRTERQPQILRVTMLFRRDRGAWKIIHRHADTVVDLPTAHGLGRSKQRLTS